MACEWKLYRSQNFSVIWPTHQLDAYTRGDIVLFYGHYPTSTIITSRDLRRLLSGGTAYLCGHLHTGFSLADPMWTKHPIGLMELELADWAHHHRFVCVLALVFLFIFWYKYIFCICHFDFFFFFMFASFIPWECAMSFVLQCFENFLWPISQKPESFFLCFFWESKK